MSPTAYMHSARVAGPDGAHAYLQLVNRSNTAHQLSGQGKLAEAEALYRDILKKQPEAGFDQVSIALNKHHLGEVLRRKGQLDEAEKLLTEALEVRERHDTEAKITIALSDSNITRDELAKVAEARGDYAKVLEIREEGKRICGYEDCAALDYDELHACSRCKCVFYCGKDCQRSDWQKRHRTVCKPTPKATKKA
ncbi:hypothetical protein Poli38472_003387 [Pythium oligandrum]|uniref:phytol kinase n=1 Tax=Pythium oligandrum TaxID=41045 RepID=A0A8K1C7J2_PYTOL|nr:hypothetical protein Poli38472_003387 [Pythium oligandrum]|eukprot:TMW57462.1 hypothetical protein Poli38472_003387 [Pythium oligandrum]